MPTGQSTYFNEAVYFDTHNPFRAHSNIGQCTWYCWSKAHSKAAAYPERKLNVSKLPTCNAGDWFTTAQNNGYKTGSTPKNDSIAVWGRKDGRYGHVAYVETWDGTDICYSEANMNNVNNDDNTIQVSSDYLDTIKNNVSNVTANLRITVTVKGSGKDGLFQTKSRKAFEGRMPKKGFLGYIYLN